LRPGFEGAISFSNVTFSYPGTRTPALDRVSFSVPAGTMLGVVGRSGSGKSTVTRLLQGINRDYAGSVKIDGTDLREISLRHLRSSFGAVLQENFMFRSTIRDNILYGRWAGARGVRRGWRAPKNSSRPRPTAMRPSSGRLAQSSGSAAAVLAMRGRWSPILD
jgi:ABC-type multidrug transport system fused ATPase/permease subunit